MSILMLAARDYLTLKMNFVAAVRSCMMTQETDRLKSSVEIPVSMLTQRKRLIYSFP